MMAHGTCVMMMTMVRAMSMSIMLMMAYRATLLLQVSHNSNIPTTSKPTLKLPRATRRNQRIHVRAPNLAPLEFNNQSTPQPNKSTTNERRRTSLALWAPSDLSASRTQLKGEDLHEEVASPPVRAQGSVRVVVRETMQRQAGQRCPASR